MLASLKSFKRRKRGLKAFYVVELLSNETLKMNNMERHLQKKHSQRWNKSHEIYQCREEKFLKLIGSNRRRNDLSYLMTIKQTRIRII